MPLSIGQTLAAFLLSAVRIVLYLPLLALRVLARLTLFVATVLPVAFPILAGYAMYLWWLGGLQDEIADLLAGKHVLVTALAYFVAIGLFASFLKSIIDMFWVAVRDIISQVGKDILRKGWIPSAEIFDSLAVSWRDNVAKIPENVALTTRRSAQVTVAVIGGTILAAAAIPFLSPVNRYVALVTTADAQEEDTRRELETHMRNGTVFSLVHLKDAQIETAEGICLDESQQVWLREFRNAIVACVTPKSSSGLSERTGRIPRIEVKAFASAAPVKSIAVADAPDSAELNCEIANWRADAVGAFLANKGAHKQKWSCPSVAKGFNATTNFCASSSDGAPAFNDYLGFDGDRKDEDRKDALFEVRVRRWQNPSDMHNEKPADDGALSGQRRFGVEMFNRAVHITVPNGFCSESEQAESQSAAREAADAETSTEEEPSELD